MSTTVHDEYVSAMGGCVIKFALVFFGLYIQFLFDIYYQ